MLGVVASWVISPHAGEGYQFPSQTLLQEPPPAGHLSPEEDTGRRLEL